MRAGNRDESGFALLQAVAVVAILGAIAAVVLAVVRPVRVTHFTTTCTTDVNAIRAAAESVRNLTGGYPDNTQQLFASPANPAANGALTRWPSLRGVAFVYSGNGPTYHLGVLGPKMRGIVLDQSSSAFAVTVACSRI